MKKFERKNFLNKNLLKFILIRELNNDFLEKLIIKNNY